MQIKIFNSNKKLNRFLLKVILKETKLHNNLSLGIGYENGILPFFQTISKYPKIKWNNIKIISLIEYFDHQSTMFYALMQRDFISKLNGFDIHNFSNKIEDIKNLKDVNNLNSLYNNQIDLGIFFLDFRGNFLLNDYESKCNFIHISTNGDKIISPGLKSIFSFFKIIIIANDQNSQVVLKKLVSKEIDEDDPFTFLNFHKNSILLTLSSLVSKKNIAKSVNSKDIEKWSKKLFKDNQHFEENDNLNVISGDKYIDDNLDEIVINSEKSLDNELEEALKIIDENREEESIISDEIESNQIVDDSLLNNLNENYFDENNNFDQDLYGNNIEDKNLFNSNDLLDDNKNEETFYIDSAIEIENKENVNCDQITDNSNYNQNSILLEEEKREGINYDPIIDNSNYNQNSILLEEQDRKNDNINPVVDDKLDLKNAFDNREKLNFNVKEALNLNKYLYRQEEIKVLEPKVIVSQELHNIRRNNMNEINYLERVIKIKEDTLKTIEALQNLNTSSPKNTKPRSLQFKYIPGIRPTPMLAIYDTPNFDVYSNIKDLMMQSIKVTSSENNFTNNFKHFWNHGAYIIFDEVSLEIKAFLFSDFSNFIFLLRNINKELWFYVINAMELIFENESKIFIDEFLLINK